MSTLPREIVKASGLKEAFDQNKFCASLQRAGLNSQETQSVCQKVIAGLPTITSSEEVLRRTINELNRRSLTLASRYNLKRAIMELGPTGFPFERYLAAVLSVHGY